MRGEVVLPPMAAPELPAELKAFADRVVERRLPNGLTTLIVPRKTSATAHFAIGFRVGGVDEPEGRSGIAHLFEHMAFKGTTRIGTKNWAREKRLLLRLDDLDAQIMTERARGLQCDEKKLARLRKEFERTEERAEALVKPNELDEIYARNGAKGLNAYTSKDATVYIVNLPANRVKLWVAMEAARIREPVLRQFYRERNVVIEELRRYDDNPNWRLQDAMPMLAFTAHPYRTPIIGWRSDLERMTRKDLEFFFRQYYRPDRAVLAAVGDVEPKALLKLIKKEFSFWRAGTPPRPITTEEPEQRGERRAVEHMPTNPLVGIVYPTPTWGHPDKVAMDALAAILGHGDSSRLHTVLVKQKQLAVGVHAGTEFPGERFPNLFLILAVPRSPHGPAESEKAIIEEIDRVANDGVSQRELDKVTNLMEAEIFQRLADNSHLAATLAHVQAVTGDWRMILKVLQQLRALTPADILRVARERLVPQRRSVVTILPPESKS